MVIFLFLNIFVFLGLSVPKLAKKENQQKSGRKCVPKLAKKKTQQKSGEKSIPSTSSCPTSIKDFLKAFSSSTASKAKETGIIFLMDNFC